MELVKLLCFNFYYMENFYVLLKCHLEPTTRGQSGYFVLVFVEFLLSCTVYGSVIDETIPSRGRGNLRSKDSHNNVTVFNWK